jgi:hypothetical protein
MFTDGPDPHPGRCKNHRAEHHSDGYIENLRCLEAEGTRHICRFPKPAHVVAERVIYTAAPPEPWVVPPRG